MTTSMTGKRHTRKISCDNSERALQAVADLSIWLGMTEEHIADIAGFSRRNYPNWRAGKGSHAKTVRGLFEIHALISSLVRTLGTSETLSWLMAAVPGDRPRQEMLAAENDRIQLFREASPFFFAKIERESLVADFEDD